MGESTVFCFKSCMQLINNNIAEQKKEKYREVWEWGMGSLLNYVCYGENELLFVEGQLPPCSMRTKWVAGGCAGFTQHVAEVSEG